MAQFPGDPPEWAKSIRKVSIYMSHGQENFDTQSFWCEPCRKWISREMIDDEGHPHFTKDTIYFIETRLAYEPYGKKALLDKKAEDLVNHPTHYTFGRFEVIDVLQDWFPDDPLLWQVVKYLARARHKNNFLQDLQKAQFYLNRAIEEEKK